MMKATKQLLFKYRYLLLLAVVMFVCFPLFAQTGPTPAPTPTPTATLAGQVIVIAGLISTLLKGLQTLIPGLTGKVALAVNIVLAIAGAYAVAQPGQVLTIQFLCSVVGNALGSMGIYDLLKKHPEPVAGAVGVAAVPRSKLDLYNS
jgi:hypothetical protein